MIRYQATNNVVRPGEFIPYQKRKPVIITEQPQGQTVTEPAPATFTVAAENAESYQWQVNGTPQPGEEGTSFTIDPTAVSMDGDLINCLVCNRWECEESDSATLNVNPPPP